MATTPEEALSMINASDRIIRSQSNEYCTWLLEGSTDQKYLLESVYGLYVAKNDRVGFFNGLIHAGQNVSKGSAIVQKVLGYRFDRTDVPNGVIELRQIWNRLPEVSRNLIWVSIGRDLSSSGKPMTFIAFGREEGSERPIAVLYHYHKLLPEYCLEWMQSSVAKRPVPRA